MELGPYLAALVALGVGVVLNIVGWWANRKLGLNPAREALVATLQASNGALKERIVELERVVAEKSKRIDHLEQEVIDLRGEVQRMMDARKLPTRRGE